MNEMQQNQDDIKKELEELEAFQLKALMEGNPVHRPPLGLDEKILNGVYTHLVGEKREVPMVDLRSALRRSHGRGWTVALKMAAGLAAVITLGLLAYRLMTPMPHQAKDCKEQDLLTCLSRQASEDDIYNYLLHEYPGSEDIYLFETVSSSAETDLIPIELQ